MGNNSLRMSNSPTVSVVIPCYNAEQWIGDCVRSVLAQTWRDFEVVIVDDGSTDGSRDEIASFGDQVRYEYGPNRGGAAARNRGLALARGRWVQFLDADDLLVPDCIERKLRMAGEVDESIVPCCAIEFLAYESRNGEDAGPACWRHAESDLDSILASGGPQTAAPLHRREHLVAIGGFRESLRQAQDFDLNLRLAANYDLVFRSHGQVGVRIRPLHDSVSRSGGWKMHAAIADTLLHGADLLQREGKLTEARRVGIAQRATLYARRTAIAGAIDEGNSLATRARDLTPLWYKAAYKNPVGATLVRLLGFGKFERFRSQAVKRLGFRRPGHLEGKPLAHV